jgi:hypothetical protein
MQNDNVIKGYKTLAGYTGIPQHTLKEWAKRGILPNDAIFRPTQRTVIFNRLLIDQWLVGQIKATGEKRAVGRPRRVRHD